MHLLSEVYRATKAIEYKDRSMKLCESLVSPAVFDIQRLNEDETLIATTPGTMIGNEASILVVCVVPGTTCPS